MPLGLKLTKCGDGQEILCLSTICRRRTDYQAKFAQNGHDHGQEYRALFEPVTISRLALGLVHCHGDGMDCLFKIFDIAAG